MSSIIETQDKLWERLPPAEVATDGRTVYGDVDLGSRIERFQRAQATHAGLDSDELDEFARGSVVPFLERIMAEPELAASHVYSMVVHAMIVAALAATGLDPADVRWDDVEELDTSTAGGYVHGGSGVIVRLEGVTEDGQHVVLFDAGTPGERQERWCAEHFAGRFTPIEDVPILGGES